MTLPFSRDFTYHPSFCKGDFAFTVLSPEPIEDAYSKYVKIKCKPNATVASGKFNQLALRALHKCQIVFQDWMGNRQVGKKFICLDFAKQDNNKSLLEFPIIVFDCTDHSKRSSAFRLSRLRSHEPLASSPSPVLGRRARDLKPNERNVRQRTSSPVASE